MHKPHDQSNMNFRLMAIEFRFRDWLRPPDKILLEAGLIPGMTVVDFGCGPGGFSIAASRLVGTEGYVYAVDIHPLALRSIQKTAVKQKLKNIRAVPGAKIADIANASVDMLLLYDILHGLPSPSQTLVELRRLLKPEGILSVSDHHLKEAPLLSLITGAGLYALSEHTQWTYQFKIIKTGIGKK